MHITNFDSGTILETGKWSIVLLEGEFLLTDYSDRKKSPLVEKDYSLASILFCFIISENKDKKVSDINLLDIIYDFFRSNCT